MQINERENENFNVTTTGRHGVMTKGERGTKVSRTEQIEIADTY